ncbi:MAG: hypothetical protein QXS10_07120 [Candidatus Bathyarchaeia archaeon]|nr:hypothetical protein [Candidatus Bathyarchaeota archaeon]
MISSSISEVLSKWLSSIFPTSIIRSEEDRIEVYDIEDSYSIGYRLAYCIITKIGDQLSDYYSGLGRCLAYCIESGFAPTYIAVPEGHPYTDKLRRILDAINLPIGLIIVSSSGEVNIAVKPHVP